MRISGLPKLGISSPSWLAKCFVALLLVFYLAACAPTIKMGVPPRIGALVRLKPGVSTKADVLSALGEPRGTGAGRFSSEIPYHDGWFYEYIKAEGSKAELKMLLVFFLDGRYNGHLWFSSASLMDVKE